MTKGKKITLWIIIVVVVCGGITAYRMWNKPHPKVEDAKAVSEDVQKLYDAFVTNEQEANKTYLNKTMEVSGTVAESSLNQDGKTVVVLGVSDPLGGVQCTFRDAGVQIKAGDKITVKGFCNGYTVVVLLSDCIPVK